MICKLFSTQNLHPLADLIHYENFIKHIFYVVKFIWVTGKIILVSLSSNLVERTINDFSGEIWSRSARTWGVFFVFCFFASDLKRSKKKFMNFYLRVSKWSGNFQQIAIKSIKAKCKGARIVINYGSIGFICSWIIIDIIMDN